MSHFETELLGAAADGGILYDLESGVSNLRYLLEEIRYDISGYHGTVSANHQEINRLLADVVENQSAALTEQQEVNTMLTNIEGALTYNDRSVANRLYQLNYNLLEGFRNFYSFHDSVIALLQEKGLTVDISDILNKQQELIDLVEDMNNAAVENIENITIDVTNEAYEIFYITDGNGNAENLGEFSGDVLSVGGKLLNFFFRVAFDDALDGVDTALDDLTGFYLEDSNIMEIPEGRTLWD